MSEGSICKHISISYKEGKWWLIEGRESIQKTKDQGAASTSFSMQLTFRHQSVIDKQNTHTGNKHK